MLRVVVAVIHAVMRRVVPQILMHTPVLVATHRIVMSVVVDLPSHLSVILQSMVDVVVLIPDGSVSRGC